VCVCVCVCVCVWLCVCVCVCSDALELESTVGFSLSVAGSWRYSAPVSPLKTLFDSWFSMPVHELHGFICHGSAAAPPSDCNGAAIKRGALVVYTPLQDTGARKNAESQTILMAADEFWYTLMVAVARRALSLALNVCHFNPCDRDLQA
jgi:hypothetical protein